jgi:hypothetical protein
MLALRLRPLVSLARSGRTGDTADHHRLLNQRAPLSANVLMVVLFRARLGINHRVPRG